MSYTTFVGPLKHGSLLMLSDDAFVLFGGLNKSEQAKSDVFLLKSMLMRIYVYVIVIARRQGL